MGTPGLPLPSQSWIRFRVSHTAPHFLDKASKPQENLSRRTLVLLFIDPIINKLNELLDRVRRQPPKWLKDQSTSSHSGLATLPM